MMMLATLLQQRLALVIGASVVGITASWLTATPFGLVAPVAALNLYARGRKVQLLYAILGIALVGLVWAAWFDVGGMRDLALPWATFFAVALCVAAVVATGVSAPPDADPGWAAQVVERVVGNAWATDAAGRFTYVTPAALAVLGMRLDDLNSSSQEGEFGWKHVIHPDDCDDAVATWRRCLQTGEHYNVEHRMLRASGAYGWSRISGQPLRDSHGYVLAWYGTIIDGDVPPVVSDRFADAASAALEEKAAPDAPHSLGLIHPDDRTATAHAAARAFWTGVPQVTRHRQLQVDGNYRWTETRSEPGYSTSVDIDDLVTDREPPITTGLDPLGEPEAEPIRSAKVIESIFGNGWAFDAAGRWIYLHPFAQNSLGVTPEDLNASLKEGHTAWKRLLHPDDYDQVAAAWRHCLETGDHFNVEFRFRRATGIYVWARTAARPTRDSQGQITGWFGIALDIDVYKKTVAALREREQQLQQLIDTVPALIWTTTPTGTPTYVNKRFIDITGATLKDITDAEGSPSLSVIHPDDVGAARQAIGHSLTTGDPYIQRYRQLRVDGSYRWTETRAEPLRDEDGAILQWYGVCVDIHDLVTAQEALRERERFVWQLVETLPALIDCAAPDGEPIYRSQQLREFLGYELEDLDGNGKSRLSGTLDAGVHPDDVAGVKEQYAHSLATGEPYSRKHRLRRFDGEYLWVDTRAAPMRNAEGAIVQWNVICLDIDSEVRMQEELRLARERLARASQAASLAELAASIAHEVNQPLAAIVANSHACYRWLTAEPPNIVRAKTTAERIIRDANSAADVVSRIRALFRPSLEMRISTPIASVIAEAGSLMAEEAARRRVRLDIDVESELPPVALDRVQVQQVLVNLIRNGIEAMDPAAGERILGVRVRRIGDLVQTEISDRGLGVEFPDRIFEPFFTTKEQGMGMGLAICRSIIESHGGRLWMERNEPHGATFIFTLPIKAP
ncbi:PAS domain-containing sensor histidine kinase [Mesorhizobium sp. B2-1-8]|uniref:sensor histidine kinase n=1 Tax=Mesorhizobium sp. B2-1-8 TaxID=2589967 RepID=UPI001D114D16|nr:PAS domain-containing sensor histidine kinase [Mesorhizobium sp. B2-1-8]UCI19073.1 PAS domain-containing sensor histidine kinase [Mesorhizobium sp. B2-1-8]